MAGRNALDDELWRSLVTARLESGLTQDDFADSIRMGHVRCGQLLEGRSGFTSRDILLMLEAGLAPSAGGVSARRGSRYVRPMVFRPEGEEHCQIKRAAQGAEIGVDVVVEDVAGEKEQIKLSWGVVQDLVEWVLEHG